jgi:hypothetical protein
MDGRGTGFLCPFNSFSKFIWLEWRVETMKIVKEMLE